MKEEIDWKKELLEISRMESQSEDKLLLLSLK